MSSLGSIFKSPPKPAAAPDTASTIQQAKEAAQLSQYTPQGNLIYGTTDANGNFIPRKTGDAVRVEESPFQQAFRTGSEGIALGLVDQLKGTQLGDYRSATDIESGVDIPLLGDFAGEIKRLEDETFSAGKRRLDPQFQQQRESLIQSLADRGIPLSSEAAQRELDRFDTSQSDAYQDLTFRSIQSGRDEQQRLATLGAALRGQQFNEGLSLANLEQQQRAQQFGEIGALGGFAAPFQPLNAPTVDVAGIINQGYANQLSRNKIQSANYATQLGFIGDLASAGGAAFASDLRLKENITFHDKLNGFKRYVFNYIGDKTRYIGVMAQDLLEEKPEAVTVMPNGYYGVYYDKLGFEMEVI